MQICITTNEYPPDYGGVGRSVERIAAMLKSLGHEIHIAVFNSSSRYCQNGFKRASTQSSIQSGITVHRLTSAVRYEIPSIKDYYADIYQQLELLSAQYCFDLFHAFFIKETGFVTTLLAKEKQLPIVASIRGNDLYTQIFDPVSCYHIVWTLENSDFTTFVSTDLFRKAQVLAPSIALKSKVIYNSVEPIRFGEIPPPLLERPLEGIVIGMIGKFKAKKGLDVLLDALRIVEKDIPFTLLLIGDFEERERAYWLHEVKSSGLDSKIVLTGLLDREKALSYLSLVDICVFPSYYDGFPNALLESMMAAKPIIASNVDAIGEILKHNTDGIVFDPSQPNMLASAISLLSANPELRRTLGISARGKVTAQLSPAIELDHWVDSYAQAILRRSQLRACVHGR